MSDDRRDTFIDMAENLGLDPGEAEDMVDDYLEAVTNGTLEPTVSATSPLAGNRPPVTPSLGANKSKTAVAARTPVITSASRSNGAQATTKSPAVESAPPPRLLSPEQEKAQFPDFVSTLGSQMLFIPSATFTMGSVSPDAPGNEQPPTRVSLGRYYLSRHPITNAEYEKFDPAHKARRGGWADDRHPVIYVSYLDATKFCQWLSGKERKRYRLPTEAEWEWAAKGADASTYPWGEQTGLGTLANFADANTTFPWRDTQVNDGYAETSPVGHYLDGGESLRHGRHGGQRLGMVPGLLRRLQGRREDQSARPAKRHATRVPGRKLEVTVRQPQDDCPELQPADLRQQRRGFPGGLRVRLSGEQMPARHALRFLCRPGAAERQPENSRKEASPPGYDALGRPRLGL